MKKTIAFAFLPLAFYCSSVLGSVTIDTFGSGANTFDIEFVTIGNPGNAADTTGNPNPAGSVPYVYRMGKYEINRDMITSANADGNLDITLEDMTAYGGNGPDKPATGVSWNEAARFVNWLNTSEGFSPAYKFSVQPGDGNYDANQDILLWEPVDAGYDANNLFRNNFARYVLPSVHEWYKAAYYDPNAFGGAGGYWAFPTDSNTPPTPVASGTAAGTAVYELSESVGPADITQAGGLSPYGLMGLGGNVWEWEESEFDLTNDLTPHHYFGARGVRGGGWDTGAFQEPDPTANLSASGRYSVTSYYCDVMESCYHVGFRVASIPEPSTLLLSLIGLTAVGIRPRRKSKV